MQLSRAEEAILYDRYTRIPGADRDALRQAHIALVGCGGLGGEIAHGLVRKGIGQLTLCDHDAVDASNLPRQFFTARDLGKNKAHALARNLRDQATDRTQITAHAVSFQDLQAADQAPACQVAVVGVDNNATRIAAAAHYLAQGTPVIFLAVDAEAARGYVFVQTSSPDRPCFLCLFPDAAHDNRIYGCAGASIEMLKITAGLALYAVDSLLMARPRPWNYKAVYLDRPGDGPLVIGRRPTCPLCCTGTHPEQDTLSDEKETQ
jgi:molybdopterin/thiamine biosynthesis adenylyltransferase